VRNIKLTLEYNGTLYAGWQRQSHRPSIQATLENAIAAVTRERVTVIGGGRTDAGVHALGQVANFRTGSPLAAARFPAAFNAHLDASIRVLSAVDVDPSFHARYSAIGRTYRYVILNRRPPSAILRELAYHVPHPLDVDAMVSGLSALRGRHAFTAFRAVGSNERTTECTLRTADVIRRDSLIFLTFEADRFLRHMVRMVVGTLLQVGMRKLPPDALGQLLAGTSRYRVGPSAPAHGLYLVLVSYKGDES